MEAEEGREKLFQAKSIECGDWSSKKACVFGRVETGRRTWWGGEQWQDWRGR